MEELKRELEEMRDLAEELHAALRTQHAEKSKLQVRKCTNRESADELLWPHLMYILFHMILQQPTCKTDKETRKAWDVRTRTSEHVT